MIMTYLINHGKPKNQPPVLVRLGGRLFVSFLSPYLELFSVKYAANNRCFVLDLLIWCPRWRLCHSGEGNSKDQADTQQALGWIDLGWPWGWSKCLNPSLSRCYPRVNMICGKQMVSLWQLTTNCGFSASMLVYICLHESPSSCVQSMLLRFNLAAKLQRGWTGC